MSLVDQAHDDYMSIMHSDDGAKWACTITSPDGVSVDFVCRKADRHVSLDPGTDVDVTSRQVCVAVPMVDLKTEGFESIKGIAASNQKPWKVTTNNILGDSGTYKVVETNPDYDFGDMMMFLEVYVGL